MADDSEARAGQGDGVPQFVRAGTPEEDRWRNAVKVASATLGLPPESPEVGQTARMIFNDRESFSD